MTGTIGTGPSLGAVITDEGTHFSVWAPGAERMRVVLEAGTELEMAPEAGGYWSALGVGAAAGSRYRYRLDEGMPWPDPASRFQPEGVHGPSLIVDPDAYRWHDGAWPGLALADAVIYELHVGTFTPGGTFRDALARLPHLVELGVTAIELMPVADFPGRWNWGYDPGAFFAPSRAYGNPDDLRELVDEAHRLGLAVLLDVVYNHFGPDGAYLPAFSPFVLTSRHATPWGQAVDFDGPHSEGVRRFCLENATMWLREYHFDGLRLDATFAIVDDSPHHLLAELSAEVRRLPGPPRLLIAEDPRNLRNLMLDRDRGGYGLDAVWADDFHHQVRSAVAGDNEGYYRDFSGSTADIGRTLRSNWFYAGHHSPHHGAPRGTPGSDLEPAHFVLCIQNHDQVGNRPYGSRLGHDCDAAAFRAASALLLFAPQTPLLFMGQEWAASTPFQFFTDHQGELGKAVSEGRRREFADFAFAADVPDPQDAGTFERSRLDWAEAEREPHAGMLRLYRDLLALRRSLAGRAEVLQSSTAGLAVRRGPATLLLAFAPDVTLDLPPGQLVWSSEDDSYVAAPSPPIRSGSRISFIRPGAAIVEESE